MSFFIKVLLFFTVFSQALLLHGKGRCIDAVRSLDSKIERTWKVAQGTELRNFDWLQKPLSITMNELPVYKRFLLRRILKRYDPKIDFLYERNSRNFIFELVNLFEGSKGRKLGVRATSEQQREYLTRMAIERLSLQSLRETVKVLGVEESSFFNGLWRFLARLSHHPLLRLMSFPPRLPVPEFQNLGDQTLRDLIERRTESHFMPFEKRIIESEIPRVYRFNLKKAGALVLAGILAFMLYTEVSKAAVEWHANTERIATEVTESYRHTKGAELERAEKHLNKIRELHDFKEEDPVSYQIHNLTIQFEKLYGVSPNQKEREQIFDLAIEIVESSS